MLSGSQDKQPTLGPVEKKAIAHQLGLHYQTPVDPGDLKVSKTNNLGLVGKTPHHFVQVEAEGRTIQVFCKTLSPGLDEQVQRKRKTGFPGYDTEFNHLRRLLEKLPDGQEAPVPIVVGLVEGASHSFLLVERFSGLKNLSSEIFRCQVNPVRSPHGILELAHRVLDSLFELHLNTTHSGRYSPEADLFRLSNRLEGISRFSASQKSSILRYAEELGGRIHQARLGIVHCDLGPRNVLLNPDRVVFIDWEMAEREGMVLYDACFFALSMLMRCVQGLAGQKTMAWMVQDIREHLVEKEASLGLADKYGRPDEAVSYCWLLASIHILHGLDKSVNLGGIRAILFQRTRQLEFLMSLIERDLCK